MRRYGPWAAVLCLLGIGLGHVRPLGGGTAGDAPYPLRARFEAEYRLYRAAPGPDPFSSEPISDEAGRHLSLMAAMGPGVTPLLIEKLKETNDAFLLVPLGLITKRRFVAEEWPNGKIGGPGKEEVKLYLTWWQRGAKGTAERFARLYADWKRIKATNSSLGSYNHVYSDEGKLLYMSITGTTELGEAYDAIRSLGLAALPYMMRRLRQGDYDMLPVIAELTNRRAASTDGYDGTPEQRAKRCLEWWEKNKDQLSIPFPDGAEAAEPAGAPAPQAVEPVPRATPAARPLSPEARDARDAALENARKAVEEARKKAGQAGPHAQPALPAEAGPTP